MPGHKLCHTFHSCLVLCVPSGARDSSGGHDAGGVCQQGTQAPHQRGGGGDCGHWHHGQNGMSHPKGKDISVPVYFCSLLCLNIHGLSSQEFILEPIFALCGVGRLCTVLGWKYLVFSRKLLQPQYVVLVCMCYSAVSVFFLLTCFFWKMYYFNSKMCPASTLSLHRALL